MDAQLEFRASVLHKIILKIIYQFSDVAMFGVFCRLQTIDHPQPLQSHRHHHCGQPETPSHPCFQALFLSLALSLWLDAFMHCGAMHSVCSKWNGFECVTENSTVSPFLCALHGVFCVTPMLGLMVWFRGSECSERAHCTSLSTQTHTLFVTAHIHTHRHRHASK